MDERTKAPDAGQDERSLLGLLQEYKYLLEEKDALKQRTDENAAAIKAMKDKIMEAMRQSDIPSISTGGFNYSLTYKTAYSKKSDADLKAAKLDYFTVLREEGFGDIIVERVDSRTLQSAMAHYVEEHDELSPGLAAIVNAYEYTELSRTKNAKAKTKGGAKGNGNQVGTDGA